MIAIAVDSKLPFQHSNNRFIPTLVQTLFCRMTLICLHVPPKRGLSGMERLIDVTHEMN